MFRLSTQNTVITFWCTSLCILHCISTCVALCRAVIRIPATLSETSFFITCIWLYHLKHAKVLDEPYTRFDNLYFCYFQVLPPVNREKKLKNLDCLSVLTGCLCMNRFLSVKNIFADLSQEHRSVRTWKSQNTIKSNIFNNYN